MYIRVHFLFSQWADQRAHWEVVAACARCRGPKVASSPCVDRLSGQVVFIFVPMAASAAYPDVSAFNPAKKTTTTTTITTPNNSVARRHFGSSHFGPNHFGSRLLETGRIFDRPRTHTPSLSLRSGWRSSDCQFIRVNCSCVSACTFCLGVDRSCLSCTGASRSQGTGVGWLRRQVHRPAGGERLATGFVAGC